MALAYLVHVAVSTFVAIALGLAAGQLTPLVASVSLATGTAAGVTVWMRLKDERSLFPGVKFVPALLYGFVIYAGLEHFLYLLYYSQGGLRTLHLNNFGDLTLHIQYIRYMAGGAHFWPDDPSFAGSLLRYPLGMDIYNALWQVLGVPLDSHLFLVGLALTIAAVSMLHRWMGWWGVGAFFLNGGLANWKILSAGKLQDFQNALSWKNFFLSLWITQRGLLFAVPAGVYVLKTVTEALLGERTLRREEKIICASLWASLAWFHLHTFFILTIALGIFIVVYRGWRLMLDTAAPAVVLGFVFVLFSTNGLAKAGITHLQPGWTAGQQGIPEFWLVNLGPWLAFAAAALFLLFRDRFARLRGIGLTAFLLFILFTIVMVAPWDWDNIKVLIWPYLLIAWLIWRTWISRLRPDLAALVAILAFFSGTVAIVSSLPGNSAGVELYRAADIWDAKAALAALPAGAVLAVAPDPNHPAEFWGARVAMGYPGHVWSHGINGGAREDQLERMFRGEAEWLSLARQNGVTDIYWGPNEKRRYGSFSPPWLLALRNVSSCPNVQIYDVGSYRK